MHWVALGVICVALIFVSYHSPKIGFSLLGALAVIFTALYFLNLEDSQSKRFPVPREAIELEGLTANPSYGDSWDYAGRISNTSDKSITDVQIRILLYDCPTTTDKPTADCDLIGDQIDYVSINVPARQSRDFRDNITFRHAVPKGIPFWNFELAGLEVSE